MPRAGAEAQILVHRIGQTGPRPKKIAAPRLLQRLPEERFRDPALDIGGLYSARPIWRVCWRCSKAFATMLLEVLAMSEGIFPSWAQLHQLHLHTWPFEVLG
jgi:hypothetical protein